MIIKNRAAATQKLEYSKLADYLKHRGKKKSRSGGDPDGRIPPGQIYGDSHCGFTRQRNEDSYAFQVQPDGTFAFAAVADGIGGLGNGALASRLCLQSILSAWRNFVQRSHTAEEIADFLRTHIEQTNEMIRQRAIDLQFERYMGATLAVMVAGEEKIITAHAGDSRIYRLRDGILERLTRDHTVVEQMIENGEITRQEAPYHPLAHVISRSIGINPAANPEIQFFDRQPGDRFLLCSDGLYLHESDPDIERLLSNASSPRQAVQNLLSQTLQRGAEDNVTLIAVFA